jgi:hypothetical protein
MASRSRTTLTSLNAVGATASVPSRPLPDQTRICAASRSTLTRARHERLPSADPSSQAPSGREFPVFPGLVFHTASTVRRQPGPAQQIGQRPDTCGRVRLGEPHRPPSRPDGRNADREDQRSWTAVGPRPRKGRRTNLRTCRDITQLHCVAQADVLMSRRGPRWQWVRGGQPIQPADPGTTWPSFVPTQASSEPRLCCWQLCLEVTQGDHGRHGCDGSLVALVLSRAIQTCAVQGLLLVVAGQDAEADRHPGPDADIGQAHRG